MDRQAAHDSIGTTLPAVDWYLAEGSTGSNASGNFETWVLVQNPGTDPAIVDISYQTPAGEVPGPQDQTIEAGTRRTFNVSDTSATDGQWSVSTHVTSDNAVICERAMYWSGVTVPGRAGFTTYRQAAHDSIGVNTPALNWFLAEGSTGSIASGNFETWVLIQNAGTEIATVDISFQTPTGEVPGPQDVPIAVGTRYTLNVADTVPAEWSVSTKVESDKPVICERGMYWNTPTTIRQAAHDSIGASE